MRQNERRGKSRIDSRLSYYILNKPYGVLSQFTDKEGRPTLASLFDFPPGVYPVGRLDLDSEGLLLLTNDKQLTHALINEREHEREYYVQVEGIPDESALAKLQNGVVIEGKMTIPALCRMIDAPVPDNRIPPIRFRKNIPAAWISLTLVEGRNRQVRKMTAAAGHPTLRLIRHRISSITLEGLPSGKCRPLTEAEIKKLLDIII